MAFKHKGKEIVTWIHKGNELSSIVHNKHEMHSAANLITADGFVLVSTDGFTLNAKAIQIDGKV